MSLLHWLRFWAGVILLVNSAAAWPSPWMRTSGDSSLYASISLSRSNSYWDKDGNLIPSCQANDFSTHWQYEYGYSYYHTLFAATSLESNHCGGRSATGIPEARFGVRGRLNLYRNGRTWQVTAIVPVQGEPDSSSKPGKGEFGVELGVYFLLRPDPYENPQLDYKNGEWSWKAGVTFWDGEATHELWGGISWKHPLFDTKWRFRAGIKGNYSFAGDDSSAFDPATRFKRHNEDFVNVEFSLSRSIAKRTSLSFSLGQDIWGRNSSKSTDGQIGLSYTWE